MKRMRRSFLGLLASILIGSTVGLAQPTMQYTLADLGLMGGTAAFATGVNNKGQIVGNVSYSDGHQDCFLLTLFVSLVKWTSNLPAKQLNHCEAHAINQNGEVAGSISVQNGKSSLLHGFRRTASGAMIDLPPVHGNASEAYDLNDSGIVVGKSYAIASPGNPVAVRWDAGGNGIDLGTLPTGADAVAYSINSYGNIVGYVTGTYLGYFGVWGFEWTNGSMVVLPPLSPWHDEKCYRIARGPNFLIAGESYQADGLWHLEEWGGGWHADLGAAAEEMIPTDITSDSWISGFGQNTNWNFIYSPGCPGGLYGVSNLLDSSGTGWSLARGFVLNDSHWLVGAGWYNNSGPTHVILLIPNSNPLCYPL